MEQSLLTQSLMPQPTDSLIRRLSRLALQAARHPAWYAPVLAGQATLAVERALPTVRGLDDRDVVSVGLFLPAVVYTMYAAQIAVWWKLAASLFGMRRVGAIAILAFTLAVGSAGVRHALQYRVFSHETVVLDPNLPQMGFAVGQRESVFSVSPDERWIVYGRPEPGNSWGYLAISEICVWDRTTGRTRTVDLRRVRRPRDDSWEVTRRVHELVNHLSDAAWKGDSLIVPAMYGSIAIGAAEAVAYPHERLSGSLAATSGKVLAEARARWRSRSPRDHHIGEVAATWDGAEMGETLYAEKMLLHPGNRRSAILLQLDAAGQRRIVASKRERGADWRFLNPVVSPDGRLVAYTGIREGDLENIGAALKAVLTLDFFDNAPPSDGFIFIYDAQTRKNYRVARNCQPRDLQWSSGGRSLYYVELSDESRIARVDVDIPLWKPDKKHMESPCGPPAVATNESRSPSRAPAPPRPIRTPSNPSRLPMYSDSLRSGSY